MTDLMERIAEALERIAAAVEMGALLPDAEEDEPETETRTPRYLGSDEPQPGDPG
ncbi:hypothetical protein [Longimicrobium sp.]|jgi:hypothetical protein|uniref:hypothetical protein n=1 Tax=Longimicrobium sp. TaxID=2029185 RepID=UPI002F92959E